MLSNATSPIQKVPNQFVRKPIGSVPDNTCVNSYVSLFYLIISYYFIYWCQITECQITECQSTECQITECQKTECQITEVPFYSMIIFIVGILLYVLHFFIMQMKLKPITILDLYYYLLVYTTFQDFLNMNWEMNQKI